jgi:hypothetical protein
LEHDFTLRSSWPAPVLESYTLEKMPQQKTEGGPPRTIAKVAIRGKNFFSRAISPKIMIGDLKVLDYEITPDESGIILYLFQRPKDGSRITVSYGPEMVGELEEPFRWNQ